MHRNSVVQILKINSRIAPVVGLQNSANEGRFRRCFWRSRCCIGLRRSLKLYEVGVWVHESRAAEFHPLRCSVSDERSRRVGAKSKEDFDV